MLVASEAKDVVVTNCFTGVDASFVKPSIEANGLDPAKLLRTEGATAINIKDGGSNAKAWRDIWSAGQGNGAIKEPGPAVEFYRPVGQ
jgi:nitronate monooxygenase